MKHLISILVPILNIDCQKYIFGPINIFIVSSMRILLPDGSTPILLKTALPLGFDLSLSQYGLWVPRAFHDTLWEGHLSSILYMERCSFPFLAVSTKRSSKHGFYVKPFIYM